MTNAALTVGEASDHTERLSVIATTMTQLTPEDIGTIVQSHPQRNIPQIILMIALKINNLELVTWVIENHHHVINMTVSNDTISVLHSMGINLP